MTGDTLTLADAARELGVSEKTARRWVKSGKLGAELVDGPYGQQYRVSTQAVQGARQALAVVRVDQSADPRAVAIAVAQELGRIQSERDATLRQEIAALHDEISALRADLARRLPELPPASPLPVTGEATQRVDTPERRPWWAFWR